ncbi:MAG: hypothetical protein M1820_001763 [Bogoriella megaspora]|nr:MAG: hypothetical protein M1820_001763 [Bogoriella megaspora]
MAKQYSTVSLAPEISDVESVEPDATTTDPSTSYEGAQDTSASNIASTGLKGAKQTSSELLPARKWTWSFTSSTTSSEKRASIAPTINPNVLFKRSPWTTEVLNLALGVGALVGIIAVLAYFNGQALPNWPYYITLNALVALLATIVSAAILVPVQSGLSQLKWIKYKSGRAPLVDFETFDEASRGSKGAFKLLGTRRGGLFGSFGATVAIVSLALGPFVQQIVEYRTRTVARPGLAIIPRALNYSGALPGISSSTGYVPILPMKSAVYNGLFAENNKPAASLPFTCPTGNCTWPAYDTLAICSECIDVSSVMERYCGPNETEEKQQNLDACGWRVPQGALLNSSTDVFSMTPFFPSPQGDMPYTTIMKLAFMGTESQSVANVLNPWALQCTLSFCVQTISSIIVTGDLVENVTHVIHNSTIVDMTSSELISARDRNSTGTTPSYPVYIDTPSKFPYQVSMGAKLALTGWFSTLFRAGSATRSASSYNRTISSANSDAVAVNLTVGISSGETFFDTDIVTAFYWNYYQYPNGIQLLLSDLATSMTVAMRSFTSGVQEVRGVAETMESYVHVRWAFLALPLAVVVSAALFLVCVIWRTKRVGCKAWKGSALAILRCGLDTAVSMSLTGIEDLNKAKGIAKDVRVKLDADDKGIWLRD